MNFYNLHLLVSIIVWGLIPFRQYKSDYFYFFLTLAIADPISITISRTMDVVGYSIYFPFFLIVWFTLWNKKFSLKLYASVFITAVALGQLLRLYPISYLSTALLIVLALITLTIIKKIIIFAKAYNKMNFFHFVLLLYSIITLMKIISGLIDLNYGYEFYILMNIVSIFIGIFFIVFREDSKILQFRILKESHD